MHPTHDALLECKKDEIIGRERTSQLNSLYTEKHSCNDKFELLNEQERSRREQYAEHILNDVEILPNDKLNDKMRQEVTEKPGESNTVPLVPAAYNFDMARRMAQENLEHQPLPDSIMDRAFRKLQAQGIRNPELALDVFPTATGKGHISDIHFFIICSLYVLYTGVGVRTHNAGPTHCTKLKVYRPKTCGVVPKPLDESRISSRPHTALMENMRPMDLAICWDYRPSNPADEPKPPTHIDGSNGSAAPAVFNLVKTPRTTDDLGTGRSGGVFSNTLGEEGFFEKDVMLRNKNLFSATLDANTNRECKCGSGNRQRQSSRSNLSDSRARCKSSPNLSVIAHASGSVDDGQQQQNENIIVCNYNKEHYHVRPVPHDKQHHHHQHRRRNRSLDKGRSARAPRLCELTQAMPTIEPPHVVQHSHKQDVNRIPFRTGIPKSNSSGTCTSFDSGCSSMSAGSAYTAKMVKIPKPKNPYAKKSYIIDTLAPPFACWKGGAGQGGYPEHWRLTSVYQHAYKPVSQRKRPLLATVYQ